MTNMEVRKLNIELYKLGLKFCSRCIQKLEFSKFGKDIWSPNGLTDYCKDCRNKRGREYNRDNPEIKKKTNDAHKEYRKKYYSSPEWRKKLREQHLKSTYNITHKDYEVLLNKQNNVCKICNQFKLYQKGKDYMHVDHCHKTGKIRGILCSKCNKGLGSFCDDIELMKNAIKYLEENKL